MRIKARGAKLLDIIDGAQSIIDEEAVLTLKEDRLIMQVAGPEGVIMFATLIPASSLQEYEKGDIDEVGLKLNAIKNFISSGKDMIELDMRSDALHLDDGHAHARVGTVDPGSVAGATTGVPGHSFNAVFESDMGVILDFIRRSESVVNADTYVLGVREEGFYMYSEHDNGDMDSFHSWDDFSDDEEDSVEPDLDWEINEEEAEGSNNPPEDHAADVRMSIDFTKALTNLGDRAKIHIANQKPMKILYDREDGIRMSYFQAPRMEGKGGSNKIPDSVIGKYRG